MLACNGCDVFSLLVYVIYPPPPFSSRETTTKKTLTSFKGFQFFITFPLNAQPSQNATDKYASECADQSAAVLRADTISSDFCA